MSLERRLSVIQANIYVYVIFATFPRFKSTILPFFHLLPYTKLPEYVAEDLFGVDFADDFADVEDGFADVLGEEVGGELFGQTILYAGECFASIL